MEQSLSNNFNKNICLIDNNVSLEAKGFYYSMLFNLYSGKNDIKEVIRETNEDIDFISKLIMELLKNGYLYLGISDAETENPIFYFEEEKYNNDN